MESGSKNWAAEYLIDPISAPQPSEEDGPGGTSFRLPDNDKGTPTTSITPKSASVRSSNRLSKTNPYRKSLETPPHTGGDGGVTRSTSLRSPSSNTYPSPPPSASPRREAFGDHNSTSGHRRRTSSLSAKHAGDMSHRPLEVLAKEKRIADRARHATRKHHIQPDTIDSLDDVAGAAYHHSGPYDATLFARNNSASGPLNALRDSNAETLRATPREKIIDSVRGHRPLDGVAAYAPGEQDPMDGHTYEYEQSNMMLEGNPAGGAYKRWPGVQYHPDDIKGKGEPSYSIEKALKDHGGDGHDNQRNGSQGIEMQTQSRHRRDISGASNASGHDSIGSGGNARATSFGMFDDGELPRRSGSLSQGLKKRWGSVKKHIHRDSE